MIYLRLGNASVPARVVMRGKGGVKLSFPGNKPVLEIGTKDGKLDPFTEDLLQKKASWILRHYKKLQSLHSERDAFLAKLDREILYLGNYVPLSFTIGRSRRVKKTKEGVAFILPKDEYQADRFPVLQAGMRALATGYLRQKTLFWGQQTGLSIKGLRIKDHRSKWGSCSTLGNINLNWHLIFLPETLIDYVVIHELMHLKEMNHSPAFWNAVTQYYPGYKLARKEIRARQWLIGVFDA
jgi:predicted metal-dependent hydrolase